MSVTFFDSLKYLRVFNESKSDDPIRLYLLSKLNLIRVQYCLIHFYSAYVTSGNVSGR